MIFSKIIKQWVTDSGYQAVVIKTQSNLGDLHYCGYIGIENKHPLFGKKYFEHCDCLEYLLEKVKNGPLGKRGLLPILMWGVIHEFKKASMDIIFDVHGSVTFSKMNDSIGHKDFPMKTDKPLYFIGFDCNHADDTKENYNVEYCINECESLSKQLKEVENNEY